MATGELTHSSTAVDEEPGYGAVVTSSGRISAAKMYEPAGPISPFTTQQLARLDEALTLASRETGLDFSVYLGDLGEDTRATAEGLLTSTDNPADGVVIAVSPGQRAIEVVTGTQARHRLPDRGAKLAVASMVASFKEGDLIGGLVNALRMLSDQAGAPQH
ncbi:DUF5130 family protein [Amycolatopsis keratiniphila]|uniref:Uncharacterized protein n=2 Tax=Amycolatopsis keratiniphila TaxID=129921 RepID=R4SWJ3_9PSEU|nr:DUF5130 family protein [Amycolatopsis keratiniphila]AGM04511.1 hypothetical protein AORI_1923 [Amycolatopsis keratiniphila]OLZ46652.1 DUF5130 domain-containing protein [Amycolatopsis keratiniphila subsp. nogabecina]ONF67432.1 DUF5130 domain-containing protein [Amycolatopsis keratiniphila subsp. keratiniphila]SDU41092.1 TLP18.3, Psb32 and MOLO-1 founding protein of phosphatase [Amycolatopsis keratiniphila]